MITTVPTPYHPQAAHAWLRREHEQAGAIGYWVLRRHRRHGFGRAAVGLLPELARELGLRRLQALIEPGNQASLATCRGLGFTDVAVLRSHYPVGDQLRDMIMLELVVDEV